jgi:immunity protein, SdpI family
VKTNWRIELAMLALIACMFAAALVVWPSAPSEIPVHWNAAGQVDRYGGKFEGLLLLPLMALGIYLLLRFLPNIDPGRVNYARFGGAYTAIRAGVLLLMAGIYALVIAWVLKTPVDMSRAAPIGVGALFVLFGSVLGQVKPNWFVGIRTPWTLSSSESWARTHRLGGRLFIALGVLFAATGLFKLPSFGKVAIGAAIAVVAVLVVYSYFVWRGDPSKRTTPGGR